MLLTKTVYLESVAVTIYTWHNLTQWWRSCVLLCYIKFLTRGCFCFHQMEGAMFKPLESKNVLLKYWFWTHHFLIFCAHNAWQGFWLVFLNLNKKLLPAETLVIRRQFSSVYQIWFNGGQIKMHCMWVFVVHSVFFYLFLFMSTGRLVI